MAYRKFWIRLWGVTLLTMSAVSTFAQVNIAGTWKGVYRCSQGKTGLTLTIQTNGDMVTATFYFYPVKSNPRVKSGSYELKGKMQNRRVNLEPTRWIKRPLGYGMLPVVLSWQTNDNVIHGVICQNRIDLTREATGSNANIETKSPKKESKFLLAGSVGLQSVAWAPAQMEESPLKFHTEGLKSFSLFADIGFAGRHLFSLSYDGLFKYSPSQKDMLKTNRFSDRGLEKYTFGANLAPVVLSLINNKNFFYRLARNLLSVRFIQTRTLFYGQITGETEYYYTPLSSDITFSTPVDSLIVYQSGTSQPFKTLFVENEVIVPLFTVNYIKGRDISHQFIAGLYSTSYQRPATFFHYDIEDTPMYVEQEFFTKGFLFGVQTIERSYPGLNFDWKFLGGKFDNKISTWNTSLNEYYAEKHNMSIHSSGFTIQMWYNHYFSNSKSSLTFGFGSSALMWILWDMDPSSEASYTIETETRSNVYIRYLYRL